MKDLYTFDYSTEEALNTYESVKHAYTRLFDELKIPYLVAVADSGDMGGDLSHEFHFISPKGEDTIITCSHCDHIYNEELADGKSSFEPKRSLNGDPNSATLNLGSNAPVAVSAGLWMAVSKDKRTLARAWYPKYLMQGAAGPTEREVNSHAAKAIANAAGIDLDPSVENPLECWLAQIQQTSSPVSDTSPPYRILDLYDSQVRAYKQPPLSGLPHAIDPSGNKVEFSMLDCFPRSTSGLQLLRVHEGDRCPRCTQGSLRPQRAIELGHTFHLGIRYSEVLQASVIIESPTLSDFAVRTPSNIKPASVPLQMGCHGIGVSRMISAVADALADAKGLNWPRVMAPYEVVVIPAKGLEAEAEQAYDALNSGRGLQIDAILDDRDRQIGWKLADADLIGYPIIVVVGKGWKRQGTLEVQCRRLDGFREEVPLDSLPTFVKSLLDRI
jgi:prolyl-tRNA synthetase